MLEKKPEPIKMNKDIFADARESTELPFPMDDLEDPDHEYEPEYVSIEDIARQEGFWIDDDGHWQELNEVPW